LISEVRREEPYRVPSLEAAGSNLTVCLSIDQNALAKVTSLSIKKRMLYAT